MSPQHRQQLEDILFKLLIREETAMQTALDRMIERLGLDTDLVGLWGSHSAINNFRGLMTNLNGRTDFLRVISDIIENKLATTEVDTIDSIRNLLSPYGYTVQLQSNRVVVVPVSQSASTQQRQTDQSWLRQNVPSQSVQYLDEAREELGNSNWQDSLFKSRLSLESLATNNDFERGLRELIQQDVIQEGGRPDRKKDAELLRAIYGFTSTYGSHSSGQTDATEQRARLGLFQTEEAIIFLTKRIQAARSAGRTLSEWR